MPPASPRSRPGYWRLLAPAVFALAGLLFATSFQAARGTDLRSDRGLPGLIDGANRDVAAKSAAITTLQTALDALTAAAVPSTTGTKPAHTRSNVVLPAPLGPCNRTTSPCSSVRSTPASAGNLPSSATAEESWTTGAMDSPS